jgi:hypothetical protein
MTAQVLVKPQKRMGGGGVMHRGSGLGTGIPDGLVSKIEGHREGAEDRASTRKRVASIKSVGHKHNIKPDRNTLICKARCHQLFIAVGNGGVNDI